MNICVRGWEAFEKIAKKRGLTRKVVGDYAYTNSRRTRHIKILRIGRDGKMCISEDLGKHLKPHERYKHYTVSV